MRKTIFVLVLSAVLSLPLFATPIDETHNTIKEKYRSLEVGAFTVGTGVEVPPDYFTALPQEIASELQEAKVFDKVSLAADAKTGAPSADVSVLRMTGVVTAFHPGSRRGRYFGGGFNPGANTQIYAFVQFVDAATNTLIVENEVVGTLSGGFGGGDSKNVVHEFAKSLVETTKFVVLKPPLAPGDEPVKLAADVPRETIELSDSAFEAVQPKMNELATKGYRLVNFTTTSYQTANLVMAKTSDSAQYQYHLYKAILPSNVQKELTKKSLEGYRYRPHTMIMLKNRMFVIAERDSAALAARYEYRVHATIRLSSAEKDIREDQAQGFALIDCRKTMENHHLLLLEKKLDAEAHR